MSRSEEPLEWNDVDMVCSKCGHEYDGQACLVAQYAPLCRECRGPGNFKFTFRGAVKYATPDKVFNHPQKFKLWEAITK